MESASSKAVAAAAAAAESTLLHGQDSKALRSALGSFATGITVVTVCGPSAEWVGLTVNSFNSVSLEPPLVLWSLALSSPNREVVSRASHYAVNVLAADQGEISQRFASKIADKFAGLDCRTGASGVPLLPGCCAWFECRTVAQYPGGDHLILLGEIERFEASEAAEPLAYSRGRYKRLVDL
jgi:flavin reductase (DIM6/NTAB) family NADH-FMN oxidoreductase RutF